MAARVRNQSDARFLAALHLVAHHGGARDHADHPVRDPFPADEVGAALGWSTGSASYQLGLADAIVQRLPKLYEAMAEGWLDLGKATTVVEATRAMPDDLAGMAVAHVLPVAAGVSKAELALRLDVAAGQLDPDWATRRERAARRNVRVEGIRNPTGTDDVALRARRMLHHTCHGDVPVECRLVLVDADGHLEHVLLMPLSRHRRPRPTARGIVIVELAIPTTDLVALDPATPRPTRSGTRGCAAPSSASSPSPSGARSSAGHATPPPPPTTPPAA